MIELSLTPGRAGIEPGNPAVAHVLLRIRARPVSPRAILPLNLALVIDRSGSMTGPPIDEALRCVRVLVGKLGALDRVAVVAYNHEVDVIAPSRVSMDRDRLNELLRAVRADGATALHDGWLAGAAEVAPHIEPKCIGRVILLSDGMANRGIVDGGRIANHCGELARTGVTTTTVGLGLRFNEDLMTAMAREGRGNAYYGQSADDLSESFAEEIELLRNIIARDLRLSVRTGDGTRSTLLNLYPSDNAGRAQLPDLAIGGEAWALFELSRSPDFVSDETSPSIEVELAWTDHNGDFHSARSALAIPVVSPLEFAHLPEDQTVATRLRELRFADLQDRVRAAAGDGSWNIVADLMRRLETESHGDPWLTGAVARLAGYVRGKESEAIVKEGQYRAIRMRSRLVAEEEDSARWSAEREAARHNYLRRKLEQGRRHSADQPL